MSSIPVYTGVRAMVVEGTLRADTALLTLPAAALRDREGRASALAGRDTGAILHGVRAGDGCTHRGGVTFFF